MKTTASTSDTPRAAALGARRFAILAREYFELTKPRVVALIVFTAVVGMFLSAPGALPLGAFVSAPSASRSRRAPQPRSTTSSIARPMP